jgi:hypothetical protein
MQRRREARRALTTRRVTVAPIYEEHVQCRANRAVNNGTLGTAIRAVAGSVMRRVHTSMTPGHILEAAADGESLGGSGAPRSSGWRSSLFCWKCSH